MNRKLSQVIFTALLTLAVLSQASTASIIIKNLELDFNSLSILESSINIDPNSNYIIRIKNIPQEISAAKMRSKNLKGSNIKLLKRRKRRKVRTAADGTRFVDFHVKTKNHDTEHMFKFKLQKKRRVKFRTISNNNFKLKVSGTEDCAFVDQPTCGFFRHNQLCSDNSENICLQVLSTEYLNFDNVCEMQKSGAEFSNYGSCDQLGFVPGQPI